MQRDEQWALPPARWFIDRAENTGGESGIDGEFTERRATLRCEYSDQYAQACARASWGLIVTQQNLRGKSR